MMKTLLKKQLLEFCRIFFYNRKAGVYKFSKGSVTGRIILFVFIYLCLFGAFFALSALIGTDLIKQDLSWIYFMIMSMMAFLVGVIANAFSAASQLFQAKDNEFLLSLPISPLKILASRMASVYILGLIYESMVMLPAILFYFIIGKPSFLSVILCFLSFFELGFVVLTFSCLLGWLVALISSKLKNKAFLSVFISVIIIGLFIWFRIRANTLFQQLAAHAKDIGLAIQGWGYPLYAIGLGMSGNILGFLAFTALAAILFGLTCLILSKSFLRITTNASSSVEKGTFSMGQVRSRSINAALRRKEMKRFTSSPNYMLNCGLGLLFLLAGGVILLIKAQDVRLFTDSLLQNSSVIGRALPVLGTFAVCLFLPLCDIAAPSISLEGKTIWLLQSLPVDPYAVFKAKLYVHVVIAAFPALFANIAIIIVLKVSAFTAVCMVLCTAAFLLFTAVSMLAMDLKRPMMDWVTETQPIKQNLNILFSWLGGLFLALVLGALYLLFSLFAAPEIYLLAVTVLLLVFTWLFLRWLKNKGRKLFAVL